MISIKPSLLKNKMETLGEFLMQRQQEKIHNYQVNVVLPTNYDSEKAYRTIYMHDGGNAAT